MSKEIKDVDHIWKILNGEEEGTFQMKGKHVPILREILLGIQDGICPICSKHIDDPVLDHHHTKRIGGTGLIRGILCRTCNSFISKPENSCKRYKISMEELPNTLRACAIYFENEDLPFIHPSEAPKIPILKKASYNKLSKAYNGRGKFPPYRTNPKGKPAQKMTVKLQSLFDEYSIEPEFYGGK